MDCHAFCLASSYQIKPLFDFLRKKFKTTLFKDVIHVEISKSNDSATDLFYFPYGALVCWGISFQEATPFLEEAHSFQKQSLKIQEQDIFSYTYGDTFALVNGEFHLPNRDPLIKLALSHGFAQSVKLGAFEHTTAETFEKNRHIPEDLAKKGQISLSKREIRKKMGQLFIDRSLINLHADVLDTPEFFWEHPELEPIYTVVANELDIKTRGQVLNQRLDVMRELFEMLGNELNHQHSSRLEVIIILLIFIEVVITLMTHYNLV